MNTLDLSALLRGNPYPGRGIVLGKSAVFMFFRSSPSRMIKCLSWMYSKRTAAVTSRL